METIYMHHPGTGDKIEVTDLSVLNLQQHMVAGYVQYFPAPATAKPEVAPAPQKITEVKS